MPATATKKRYRLLQGCHHEGNRKAGTSRLYDAATDDNIVGSEVDLVKRFGKEKFERVYESDSEDDRFDNMTVSMLREFAEAEEIDLPPNANKEQIVAAVRAAQ